MRSNARIFFLAMFLLLAVGCSVNDHSKVDKTLDDKVTIKAYYEAPESLKNKETIILDGVSEGEFIEIVVEGEIKDFELVKLEFDGNQAILKEKEILKNFSKLTNQTIVIKTYIPDGIPSEKIKWKSSSGTMYEYIIQEHGKDVKSNQDGTVFDLE